MPADLTDEPSSDREDRGRGFPQAIHDRSRSAAEELHKLLLSLATGTLAVYFVALTATDSELTRAQKLAAGCALIAMATSVLSGMSGWYADARRNYYWASAMQAHEKSSRSRLYKARDRWLYAERRLAKLLGASFAVGIISSVAYMMLRVLPL